jgi:uncharacterized protein YecE (DUF72 family)
MELYVGTSGFAYKEWKGSFYPEDLPHKNMLQYYGEQLRAVEINNTFYRMPKASLLESWAGEVPRGFRFVLKASQRITHQQRLKEGAGDSVAYLLAVAGALNERLGPLFFQLPPSLRKDVPRLRAFLELLAERRRAAVEAHSPSGSGVRRQPRSASGRKTGSARAVASGQLTLLPERAAAGGEDDRDGDASGLAATSVYDPLAARAPVAFRAAFELRHESWFVDPVYNLLHEHQAALCIADAGDDLKVPFVATADWGYLRLRRPGYDDSALAGWVKLVQAQDWKDAFVFFKHEGSGTGPRLAKQFVELAERDLQLAA